MIENDFNTINPEIQTKKENDGNSKDKRKTLVVFMILVIGQVMCILNTLINNFTTKTFQYQYPILYNGGFYLIFFLIWMIINRKITEPKRYYYLIIILETQSFFFDYLSNYSYSSEINKDDNLIKSNNNTSLINNTNSLNETIIDTNSKFQKAYPSYINFPVQFILTFILFLIFIKKKYYFKKRHYFSIFLGIISVSMFSYFYLHNYFKNIIELFKDFKTSSKVKVIIFSFLSNSLLSLSYILQEHFFKSGKEIYEFFPYKSFLSMLILGFESFCVGEFQYIKKEIFTNKDIALNFFYFCAINSIYLSVIPFLIKHITSVILVINYINYLFYYYIFYLSKENFLQNYGLLIIFGLLLNILCFYIFVKYKVKKSYQNMKETMEKMNVGSLLYDPNKYDINKADTSNSTNVEMNLQISNSPLDDFSKNN